MGSLARFIGAGAVLLASIGLAALSAGSEPKHQASLLRGDLVSGNPRIEGAFRAAAAAAVQESRFETVTRAAQKRDRLRLHAACTSQTWPSLSSECLAGTGPRSRPPIRTVTVEYRLGDNTSVLVRLPAQQAGSEH